MRKLLIIVIFIVSPVSYSQEEGKGCELVMVNFKWPDKKIIYSNNTNYIARLEPADFVGDSESQVPPKANIYKLKENNAFVYMGTAELNHDVFPAKAFISDAGYLVTYGERNDQIGNDDVYIYHNNNYSILNKISASDVLTEKQQKEAPVVYGGASKCAPVRPWICWSIEPYVDGEKLWLFDIFGHQISIGLRTGEITRTKSDTGCNIQ